MLHSSKRNPSSGDSSAVFVKDEYVKPLMPFADAVVKKEYEDCDSQGVTSLPFVHSSREVVVQRMEQGQDTECLDIKEILSEAKCNIIPINSAINKDSESGSFAQHGGVHHEGMNWQETKVKSEIFDGIVDKLDHIPLKDRQRMLLARKMSGLSNPAFESGSQGLFEGIMNHSAGKVEGDIHSADEKLLTASNQFNDIREENNTLTFESPFSTITESSDHVSLKSINSSSPHEEQDAIPAKNDIRCNLTSPNSVKVKDEPWDNNKFHIAERDAIGNLSVKMLHVKSEWKVHNEYHDVEVENMSLRDRMRFLISREDSNFNTSTSYNSLKKDYASDRGPVVLSAEPFSFKHPRKRKKTATDSVETALEEDAPGLLQVLVNKGVMVDEIKLYGERESDEALDESLCEDSFAELEAVISKLFSTRQSFLKFPPIRAGKASRASYCLTCLISLVEQARYLQFRKWPVEWGWCRDLQSFIFVFERHHRIVLERPEYGYATYFFELVESFPIDWQIKRMVTAMKLSSCGRISLIENKALSVGEDLTEGEAQVLMDYGWVPNSGLGTMLNYCDRVVHDRKNENDTSEWRSKIGRLLADGYNGGSIVAHNIPKKLQYSGLLEAQN